MTERLAQSFPADAVERISYLLAKHEIELLISRERVSKLGDFRPRRGSGLHRISVNSSLNKYEFLLVFLHELAHLVVYREHGRSVRPHGKEWKTVYGGLIREFIHTGGFHRVLHDELLRYSYKVKAAGVADFSLALVLRMFDEGPRSSGWNYLEEVPEQSLFRVRSGRAFRKGGRIRKRFRCFCEKSNQPYLIHPMVRVYPTVDK